MRLHRFILDYGQAQEELSRTIHITDSRIIHQIRSVLRLKAGDQLVLCDGNGTDACMRITAIKAKAVEVCIESLSKNMFESSIASILYCAILKKDSFEWVVQKCTEVGITHIVPVLTQRTVKNSLSLTRLRSIAQEAAEQSGRGKVPLIAEPLPLKHAMNKALKSGAAYFFDPSGDEQAKNSFARREKGVSIFIGPEGGWDPYELDYARVSGARIMRLGKTILRAETAAIIASYVLINT